MVSEKDGNGKEKKELISLGVLQPGGGEELSCHRLAERPPLPRRFSGIGRQAQERTRMWQRNGYCEYRPVSESTAGTCIFEVIKGPKFDEIAVGAATA